jgi:glucose/arabinose dehydrogenase/N-acetylneuraminic acid mutarotase/endonuclease YncB( thermonuclease family)
MVILLWGGAQVAWAQAPPPGSGTINLTGFVRVIDGDTLETRLDGKLVGIGLIGIRAARGNTPCGELAASVVAALLEKPGARLEEDLPLVLDARKRRLYHLVTGDGKSLARELVKAGVAKSNGKGREALDLVRDEEEAKNANRGCINSFPTDKDNKKSEDNNKIIDFLPSSAPALPANPDLPARDAPAMDTRVLDGSRGLRSLALQTGFSQQIIASGFTEPTAFTFLPDGRVLVAEKAGRVLMVKNGAVLPAPFVNLTDRVNAYWDHGLLGIATDPNFATNGFVYFLYTFENDAEDFSGSKTQQLLRVKAVGDTASTSPADMTVILGRNVGESCDLFPAGSDCIPAHSANHAIGALRFGSDGSLFVSIGDDTTYNVVDDDALRAQDRNVLTGKVLRISPATGAGFTSNPFFGLTGNINATSSKVWAYGLRNPFRFGLRAGDNLPLIGDVGWNTFEEVNVGVAGANFGWPCYEGSGRQPGYELRPGCQPVYAQVPPAVAPVYFYDHTGGGASITGGAFYNGVAYPEQHRGAYFFGDYVRGWIRYLRLDANSNLVPGTPVDFATQSGGPVDIQAGPDTNLYYLDINAAQLLQIRYSGTNTPPSAAASANPTNGLRPLQVQLSSAGSGDPDGDVLQYSWNFGDGSAPSNSPNPRHNYTVNGSYTAVLTVSDGRGGSANASVPISVGNRAPTPTISAPLSTLRFKVGDVIALSGSATDPDTGPLPGSALSWQVNLEHCQPAGCHVHSLLQATGASASVTAPDHGDTFNLQITLTATDSGGLKGSTSVLISGQTSVVTLATQPAGLQVVHGGVTGVSPMTRALVVGSAATISTPSPQTMNGTTYGFAGWSDSGTQQHNIVVGTQNATYTASFGATSGFAPIRVNAGGPAHTDPQGVVWSADTGFSGGSVYSVASAIAGTTTPVLYQTERWHTEPFTYTFAVPNGTYTVGLKFAEIYHTNAGQRVFNIGLNGLTVQSGFDIFVAAGGANRAVDRSYPVTVANGQIVIQLTPVVEYPKISAIEIVQGQPAVNVSVSPATVSRGPSQTQQFTATVTGTANTAVTWSIRPNVGTISAAGLYTAPSTITTQQTVTVTATSQADATNAGTATVTLTPPATVNVTVSPATVSRGPSQTQQFTATVTGTTNTAVTWSISPNMGTISTAGLYTAPSTINTQRTVTVTATSQADATKAGTATVTLTPPVPGFTPIRVNAGGAAHTDPQGLVWSADTGFSGGDVYLVTAPIAGTTTPVLYQSERWNAGPLTYSFTVPNGAYTVTLKFAEIYFTSAGQRVFNIGLNGQTVQSGFDIFTAAGGANRAVDRSYPVTVAGGQIAIQLTPAVENPKISAIEIVQGQPAVNVTVSPSTVSRGPSQTQQFTATVTGTANTAVTWLISPNIGTISAAGLYTAPSTITTQQTVTVTATSQADPARSASAIVTLVPPVNPSLFSWDTKAPGPIGRMEAQGGVVIGKLYIFGGFTTSFDIVTTRADVYDPAANTWTRVADVPEPLTHSADGVDGQTIYLIGGYIGGDPGPSSPRVWKYDTVANTWSAGPTLPGQRAGGGAARVARFLYFFGGATRTAGMNDDTDQPFAYRLDLDGGTSWTRIADLPNPRNHIGGVALNGKVYAIGGQHAHEEGPGNQAEVDVYDPATNVWTRVRDLPTPTGHVAIVELAGRILAMGNGPATADVVLYDPAANVWMRLPSLPQARASAVAGVINGAVYVTTGHAGDGIAATTNWGGVFTSKWETGTAMPVALGEVSGGIIGSSLYIVGEGNPVTLSYNLATGSWNSSAAARPFGGNHHAAEIVNGKLYLIGGLEAGSEGRVQIYDPATNTWSSGTAMPFAAGSSASAFINNEIFVAGGVLGDTSTAQAAAYNPTTNTWRTIPSMPQGLNHAASATDGARLYVFGGRTGGNVVGNGENTVQVYDPVSNAWTSSANGAPLAPLPQARGGGGKAVYINGEFYVIGGETLNGPGANANGVYDRVDIYNPSTNTWRAGAPMPSARHGIFPVAIGGRIHVGGGGTAAGHSSSGILEIYNAQ